MPPNESYENPEHINIEDKASKGVDIGLAKDLLGGSGDTHESRLQATCKKASNRVFSCGVALSMAVRR